MKQTKKPTLTWENAPDIIGVHELKEILGVGKNYASEIFNNKGFPKIEGIGVSLRADKEAVRLYMQGFRFKENSKSTVDYMILLELKKLNEQMQKLYEESKEAIWKI